MKRNKRISSGYISNGRPEKVLQLFHQMPVKPDRVIITLVFNACARVASPQAIQLGQRLIDRMPSIYFDNRVVIGSAIHMLMKFGDVIAAENLFSRMKIHDKTTYGVMLNGYYIK